MDRERLLFYKEELLKFKEKYERELASMEKDYLKQQEAPIDITGYSIHLADAAFDTYEKEKNVGLINNINNLLLEIDDALEKIESGNYGICEECNREIEIKRLDAIPYARLCINCKRRKEESNK